MRAARQPDPALALLLTELTALEPIFHTRAFGTTVAVFERRMAADYWDVGASGKVYSRAVISAHLASMPLVFADEHGGVASTMRCESWARIRIC